MVLYYIGFFQTNTKPAKQILATFNVAEYGYFMKGSAREGMTLVSQIAADKTLPGGRLTLGIRKEGDPPPPPDDLLSNTNYSVHSYARSEGFCAVVIGDKKYKSMAAHQLLSKVADEFITQVPRSEWAQISTIEPDKNFDKVPFKKTIDGYLQKYQNPTEVDSISKIQKELDETTIVLRQTINSVMERGEKLDDLVAKSDVLSASSKMFYTQAKKQNSCCAIM